MEDLQLHEILEILEFLKEEFELAQVILGIDLKILKILLTVKFLEEEDVLAQNLLAAGLDSHQKLLESSGFDLNLPIHLKVFFRPVLILNLQLVHGLHLEGNEYKLSQFLPIFV